MGRGRLYRGLSISPDQSTLYTAFTHRSDLRCDTSPIPHILKSTMKEVTRLRWTHSKEWKEYAERRQVDRQAEPTTKVRPKRKHHTDGNERD